jgi:hypothetical protein
MSEVDQLKQRIAQLEQQVALIFQAHQRNNRERDELKEQLAAAHARLTALGHPQALYHAPPVQAVNNLDLNSGQGSREPEQPS